VCNTTTISLNNVAFTNGAISNASNSSNRIGGVELWNNDLTLYSNTTATFDVDGIDGRISNASNSTNSIGGVTLGPSGLFTASFGVISNASNTNNSIGGVSIANQTLSGHKFQTRKIGDYTWTANETKQLNMNSFWEDMSAGFFIVNVITSDFAYGQAGLYFLHKLHGPVSTVVRNFSQEYTGSSNVTANNSNFQFVNGGGYTNNSNVNIFANGAITASVYMTRVGGLDIGF
jgi:hypothetical protein